MDVNKHNNHEINNNHNENDKIVMIIAIRIIIIVIIITVVLITSLLLTIIYTIRIMIIILRRPTATPATNTHYKKTTFRPYRWHRYSSAVVEMYFRAVCVGCCGCCVPQPHNLGGETTSPSSEGKTPSLAG